MANLSLGGDQFYNFVNLLLHMEGNNNSTTFTDNSISIRTVTANGNVRLTSNICVFGSSSAYFNGSNSSLSCASSADFFMTDSNFTVEFWVNFNTVTGSQHLIQFNGSTVNFRWSVFLSGGALVLYTENGSGTGGIRITGATVSVNQWYHVAIVKSGNTTSMYVDGTLSGTPTTTTVWPTGNLSLSIGVQSFSPSAADYLFGYIDELRITKGIARYTTNFTVPSAFGPFPNSSLSDPNYNDVSLLLHMDNPYIGLYYDSSNNNTLITATGVSASNTIFKFGPSSLQFIAGASPSVTLPANTNFGFGTGNFTIEGWIYPTSISSNAVFFGQAGTGALGIRLGQYGGTPYSGIQITRGNISNDTFSPFSFSANTWYHIAVVRNSGTMIIFVNGNSINSFANTFDYGSGPTTCYLSISEFFVGYMDEIRITKGVARYTSNFTPATQPFPNNIAGDPNFNSVSVLLHFDSYNDPYTSFVDSSPSPREINYFGDVKLSANQFKFGPSSAYFDGSGDYLTLVPATQLDISTGDFTIEAWVYLNVMPTTDDPVNWSNWMVVYERGSPSTSDGWRLWIGQTTLAFVNVETPICSGLHSMQVGVWYHLAVSREGNIFRLFVNGLQIQSSSSSVTLSGGSNYYVGTETGQGAYLNGYIDDLRATKGVARYTSNFTPPTQPFADSVAGDPFYNNVGLLCHFDFLPIAPIALTDNSASPKTTTSTAPYNTNSSIFGTSSILYLLNTAYTTVQYSTDWNIGSFTNYTIEFWIYYTTIDDNESLMGQMSSNNNPYWRLYQSASGNKLTGIFFTHVDGSGNLSTFGWNTITEYVAPLTWVHIAIVKSTNTWSLYINGIRQGSNQTFTWTVAPTWDLTIGGVNNATFATPSFSIDEVRITKNVARYSSDFVPTTAPFANYLTSFGNATVENFVWSNIANLPTISPTGNATVENFVWSNIANLPTISPTGNKTVVLYVSPPQTLLTTYGTGIYTISGTVKNGLNTPLARTVIAYDRATNIPEDVTTSNATTGAFTLRVQNANCYVVCLPLLSDGVNAEVFDNITPIGPV